jgi:hypothetical protein
MEAGSARERKYKQMIGHSTVALEINLTSGG